MTRYSEYDAIVIGGGFYGCSLASALAPYLPRIVILERETSLLTGASYKNQARVHNGYHYPRSRLTARSSAVNYPRFLQEFPDCVDRSFMHVYAIVRGISKVTAYQFKTFCAQVGIPLSKAPSAVNRLFNPALIEEIFVAEECAFDAVKLAACMSTRLQEQDVEVAFRSTVDRIQPAPSGELAVLLGDGGELRSRYVFNCTYSEINQLLLRSHLPTLPLKHETAELALVRVPSMLRHVGVTVRDGPFFSSIPFPSEGLHTLSHVTYTPHESWTDRDGTGRPGGARARLSKSMFMLKDCQRYIPALGQAEYVRSLYTTKTVLLRNEIDDGRPILCCRDHGVPGLFIILGAKIDNIYDIIQTLNAEQFEKRSLHAQCC